MFSYNVGIRQGIVTELYSLRGVWHLMSIWHLVGIWHLMGIQHRRGVWILSVTSCNSRWRIRYEYEPLLTMELKPLTYGHLVLSHVGSW